MAGQGPGEGLVVGMAKMELLNMSVKEHGQLEESAPFKPSPNSILQISPDISYLKLLWVPPIAG